MENQEFIEKLEGIFRKAASEGLEKDCAEIIPYLKENFGIIINPNVIEGEFGFGYDYYKKNKG